MIVGPSAAGGMSDLVAHHHHMSGFAAHHHHHHMGLGGMMAAGMVWYKTFLKFHFLLLFWFFNESMAGPAVTFSDGPSVIIPNQNFYTSTTQNQMEF